PLRERKEVQEMPRRRVSDNGSEAPAPKPEKKTAGKRRAPAKRAAKGPAGVRGGDGAAASGAFRRSLVIVESPSKARTLTKFLGQGFTVMASNGHIMDLPTSKLGVD